MNTTPNLKPVAGEIYAALGRHRRSLSDLAPAIGLSESTLRRRLDKPGRINLEELVTIARELSVPPATLAEVLVGIMSDEAQHTERLAS